MKKILLAWLLVASVVHCWAQSRDKAKMPLLKNRKPVTKSYIDPNAVVITGTLKNFNNQVEIEDMSAMADLTLSPSDRFILPDSTGHFSIISHIKKSNYFRVGRNIMYLSPGDHLNMDIDKKKPEDGVFKGTHSAENDYLKTTPFPKAGSFLEAGKNIKPTIQETIDYILQAAEERKKLLASYTAISPKFRELETARINADLLKSFQLLDTYFAYVHKIPTDSLKAFWAAYKQIKAPYVQKYATGFVNPEFLDLVVYRDIVGSVFEYNKDDHSVSKAMMVDYDRAWDIYHAMRKLTNKDTIKPVLAKIDKINNIEYREALKKSYDVLMGYGKGDMAVDFAAQTTSGDWVHLNSFTGKVIYIDFWATWCGPCLDEMKDLELMKEKYKDNPNVVFVSLSIDEDQLAWKKNLIKRNAHGIQLVIPANKILAYNVKGIPRTIIIDKSFKIAEMQGPLPSSKKLSGYIDNLLK